jgi:activator of HSP90 ATPase
MTERIARSAESIHQEVELAATPARVYAALTDAKQFHQVTLLSTAVSTGMVKITTAAEISTAAGGAFSLFGGRITGRMIEMVPGKRMVQAWRAGDWVAGAYSIAHFDLAQRGPGTLLVFDHQGFPTGQAEHLAEGWRENYWVPLARYLGRPA